MIDSGFRLQTILFLSLNQFLVKNLNNKLKSNKIENAGFPKREADVLELKKVFPTRPKLDSIYRLRL